ncbi:MAG: LacI family DNA-binding transcriptional regulator [Gemmatimonadota bacterium]|nr:LacI family DNA-binding transcriptional regulator [Gemmatimonadota bacterium]
MITIKDVARQAGVSVATVSRVYNDSANVRPHTRARVQAMARELGYSPHGAARSLITSRTHTLGLLLPDLYGEFFSEVIRGVDQAAQREGFHLLVSSARAGGPSLEDALRSMRGRVDGLIVMSPDLDAGASRRSLPHGFPVVMLNCPPSDAGYDSIGIANYEGAVAMTRHLAGLGHTRIAIIKGAEGNFDAAERLRGYRAVVRDLGLDPSPALELSGDFSEASGHAAALRLHALVPRPTAVFAANDGMAVGALSALREAGLRLPHDIALGGFDDIPLARYLEPALTSVHVPIGVLGEHATACLFAGLRATEPTESRREVLATTLVVRRSCGAQGGPG